MSIQDYWEMQHRQSNKKALTGSTLEQYMDLFNLTERDFIGKCGLEIGVGLGVATEQMSELLDTLDVVDISDTAITNLSHLFTTGYLSHKYLDKDVYDIVISHLVAQHMSTEDLQDQLVHVIASLKRDGYFYMQWADADTSNEESLEVQQGGGVLYSMDKMDELVNKANGNMQMIGIRDINKNVCWYAARIRRV